MKPNVLFILCDDIRWNAMSCAGHPALQTPNIDRIAKEGVRFANMFCTTSLCSPSRASILTGLYAHTHGVRDNFTELPATLTHWPLRLREAGYRDRLPGQVAHGRRQRLAAARLGLFRHAQRAGKIFRHGVEHQRRGTRRLSRATTRPSSRTWRLNWLKKDHAGKPWALCIGHKAPHSFYTPEAKYAHAFDNVRVPYPDTAFHLDDKPAWIRQRLYTWHGIYGPLFEWRKNFPDDRPEAVKDFENMVHAYWGTILSVDGSVGRLLGFLEETKQLDNTIIVFMGDNGLLEGEHGMVDKRTAHEPSLRIPLLVRYPALARDKVVAQQALTIDVAEFARTVRREAADRHSGQIVGEACPPRRLRLAPLVVLRIQLRAAVSLHAERARIRTDRWKYIHYPHGDGSPDRHMAELYDLKHDPDERRNLINAPGCNRLVEDLKVELSRLMKETGLTPENDKMPLDRGISKELPDQKIR